MNTSRFTKSIFSVLALVLFTSSGAFATNNACVDAFAGKARVQSRFSISLEVENPELREFESAHELLSPTQGRAAVSDYGWHVLARDAQGQVTKAQVNILVDNAGYDNQIFLIGPFNNWGKNLRAGDALHPKQGKTQVFTGVIEGLTNGMPYRILLNGKQVLDPSALMYSTPEYAARENLDGRYVNSIFWDNEQYQSKYDFVDISEKPNLVGEVELHSLIAKFTAANGQVGPRTTADTYRFITESGVIAQLKGAGYTAIEMMPFNQSVDGDAWNLRYQVYGLFAPESRYGNPTEFKKMIDEFHHQGIAVIMDSVISHFPFKGNGGSRELTGIGMDQWYKANGKKLFEGNLSPWDTYRYDYSNPYVRQYLIDSITYMMSEYKVDGVRMDNVDGIMYENGGPQLLKDLMNAARGVNPRALMIGEAFSTPNSLLWSQDQGGFGFNTKTDSNSFEVWHNHMLGRTEDLDMNQISGLLANIWNWKEVPVMRYITNHDEAANTRGGFTGAYPAQLINNPYYAFQKVKSADAFAMVSGAYHVSLLQARMMEMGSFYSNPEVEWNQLRGGSGQQLWNFFGTLSKFMQSRSSFFNFRSLARDILNHSDNDNKVISLKRRDPATGKILYILINLGDHKIANYSFGADKNVLYHVTFDSEISAFGGDNSLQNAMNGRAGINVGGGVHGKPFSITTPILNPYSVTIFEE